MLNLEKLRNKNKAVEILARAIVSAKTQTQREYYETELRKAERQAAEVYYECIDSLMAMGMTFEEARKFLIDKGLS